MVSIEFKKKMAQKMEVVNVSLSFIRREKDQDRCPRKQKSSSCYSVIWMAIRNNQLFP